MTGSAVYFFALAVLAALAGLFTAAASQDIGLSIFGYGLMGFGVFFALNMVKRHFDQAERH